MKCSVVILNWNGENMLRQFLPSVVQFSQAPDVEVVVADNGSTDQSLQVLKQFPTVRTIVLDKNYGFAEGYNRALEHLDAEYTVLLNSDIWVTADWLTPVLRYMDTHPEVVAAQPKVRKYTLPVTGTPAAPDETLTYPFEHSGAAGGFISILGYPYCRGRRFGRVETDKGQYDSIVPIDWASGCALFVRTRAYKEAGGLDAAFFAHMEEIDLCWRLRRAGGLIVCIPQSVVYHVGGGALPYNNPRKTFLNFRNNLWMLKKNLPKRRLWWVMTLRFFLDYAAALFFLIKGQPENAKAVVQARAKARHPEPEQ